VEQGRRIGERGIEGTKLQQAFDLSPRPLGRPQADLV
jgi:hypothetical protein